MSNIPNYSCKPTQDKYHYLMAAGVGPALIIASGITLSMKGLDPLVICIHVCIIVLAIMLISFHIVLLTKKTEGVVNNKPLVKLGSHYHSR